MTDEEKAKLEAEKQADGGETDDKKTTETPEELKQKFEDQKKRAEKAEAELKDLKKSKKPEEPEKPEGEDKNKINIAQPSDPLEVAKLANILSGLSEEEIQQLEIVAKAKKISLAEAKKDPLFSAWYDQVKEDARKEKAKRGASRGASQDEEDKTPEGLIPDIHKPLDEQRQAHQAAVKKMMSK